MSTFHSPYQFIPVDTNKAHKEKWDDIATGQHTFIRHDRWAKQGIHARINCTITTLSPLLIGAEQKAGSKSKPGKITPYSDKQGNPALPANSLRGMIASIVETISQSSLRVLADKANTQYSVRKPPRHALKKIGLLLQQGDQYFIYPLSSSTQWKRIKPQQIPKNILCYQHKTNPDILYADIKNSVASNISSKEDKHKQKGIIYQRGTNFKGKKWETFIPWNGTLGRKIDIANEMVEQLNSMIQSRHQLDKKDSHLPIGYRNRFAEEKNKETMSLVRSGDLLYYQEKNSHITEIAYSAIWRQSVKGGGNLYDSLQNDSQPWNQNRQTLTPAECLFGIVEGNPKPSKTSRNLASRIRFSDGECQQGAAFDKGSWILKKLDSPKPPSPSLYFSSASGHAISKTKLDMQQHTLNGRKYYLPHTQNKHQWLTNDKFPSNDADKRWNQHLETTKIIPTGHTFNFSITVENLSPEEFGLLLTALEPADNNKAFIHRLGLGKPYGLGQVRLDINNISHINRHQRYTLQGLNEKREQVWQEKIDTRYIDKTAHKTLLTIANPNNIIAPVCYPFTTSQKQYAEEKGYEWFTSNDKAQEPQYLKRVDIGKSLPILKSN